MIDNIVVGTPLVSLEALGIEPAETTVHVGGPRFLPSLLVQLGMFSSTSQVKAINRQRKHLIEKDTNLNLWRMLDGPEFTELKIGKRHFWLVVGE